MQRYRAELVNAGLAPSSINQRVCAIRAQEAADNHLVDAPLASGIGKVKGVKSAGTRTGNLADAGPGPIAPDAPDNTTLKGVRDQAILGMLLSCGLRRSELTALTFGHLQQRDGRWAILDIVPASTSRSSVRPISSSYARSRRTACCWPTTGATGS